MSPGGQTEGRGQADRAGGAGVSQQMRALLGVGGGSHLFCKVKFRLLVGPK